MTIKFIVRAARKRARIRKVTRRYPEIVRLLSSEDVGFDEFERELSRLLGQAIREFEPGGQGYLTCLFVDPCDGFVCADPDHPSIAVGKAIELVFREVAPLMVVSTSRDAKAVWGDRIGPGGKSFCMDPWPFALGPIPLQDVKNWLKEEGMEHLAIPEAILHDNGSAVWPKGLSQWWSGAPTHPPREPQGESV
jgi:hypothetical protein